MANPNGHEDSGGSATRSVFLGFGLGIICAYVIPAAVFLILYELPVPATAFAILDIGALIVGGVIAVGPLIYLLVKRRWPNVIGYGSALLALLVLQVLAIA